MTTPLGNVAGIGPRTVEFLQARGIESVEALLQADVSILTAAPGFGEKRANAVMEAAKMLLRGTTMQVVEEKAGTAVKKKAGDKKGKGGKGKKRGKGQKKGGKDKESDKKKKKGKKNKKGKKKKK
jgi:Holliday junction resolvasome RuvABC DNA-binding subunit